MNYDVKGLKSEFPEVKTMIISRDLMSRTLNILSRYWDYVFDNPEIHNAAAILKGAVGTPPSKQHC